MVNGRETQGEAYLVYISWIPSLTFFGEPSAGGPAATQVLRRLVVQLHQARASTSNG